MRTMSRAAVAALLLACGATAATSVQAQSADQAIVSVTESADPVAPGDEVTYTVTLQNNGPDPAVNGGLNISFPTQVLLRPLTPPQGFTCSVFGQAASCTTPSLAAGSTIVFTIVVQVQPHLASFADGSFTLQFGTSGTTPDPVGGNNLASVTTSWDSQQSDLSISVVDGPDPVGPDQDVSFTATVNAAGPDAAQAVNFNVYNNGSLRFRSVVVPSGFSCTLPAVDAIPSFTCSAAQLAPGAHAFTVVLRAKRDVLGTTDRSVQTYFGISGNASHDPNPANNEETETTAYVTPDADVRIEVVDERDPVAVGEAFDYLVVLSNHGPDAASSATMTAYNPNSLQFVSLDAPGTFSCSVPTVGTAPNVTCTIPMLASGATAEFVLRVRSSRAAYPPQGGAAQTAFTGLSDMQDPLPANNSVTETTTLIASLVFKDGFED